MFLIGVLVAQGVSGGVGDPTAAALFVVDSHLLAEELRHRRPARRTGPVSPNVTAVTVRESRLPV